MDSSGTAHAGIVPTLRRAWPILAIALLAWLAYWPGRHGGFVFDDFPNVVDNTALRVTTLDWRHWLAAAFSSPASAIQRPLAMLSFAANHYFTGLDPMPMKLTNVAFHVFNTALVFGMMRLMLALAPLSTAIDPHRRERAARFAAAAWALHPINLMAVLFVVQRMESLSHTFVFAGLWLYLLGRQRQFEGRQGWALILLGLLGGTALGLLAKESAVLLPLYAFCIELCLLGFRTHGGGKHRRLHFLFVAILFVPALIGLAWLLPKVSAPGAYMRRDYTLVERLLTEGRVVLDYLHWTVLPSLRELSLYHDDYPISRGLLAPPATLLSLIALSLLAAAAVWLRRRRPLASLGLLWFLGAHLLTATIIPLELVYEHRNYFASLGIALLLADLLLLAPRQEGARRIGALLACIAVTAFAATTHLRAREWRDPYRFAASEAAKHPASPRAAYALGQTLTVMSGFRADSPLLEPARDALERARRLPGNGILAHSGLLLLAANTDTPQRDEWWLEMQQRLRSQPLAPQDVGAIASLVRCTRAGVCRFPPERMTATFEAALHHGPNAEVLSAYGDYELNVLQQPEAALRMWREVVAVRPGTAQYRINLTRLLIATGHDTEARSEISRLRTLGRLGQNEKAAAALESQLDAKLPAPTVRTQAR